ncbi:MAG: gamma-glutamylcyclotransferase [Streptosporangiales bacterium]|nr:gamma-glutamylcyclotransferase [Streptosporangiales bacterium]
MSNLLFSYGTLQRVAVQKATFGRRLPGVADAVIGHVLSEVRVTDPAVIAASGSDVHPMLLPSADPDAVVEGTVFELDDDDLAAADAYEDDAYTRSRYTLRSGRRAWIYALATANPHRNDDS